MGEATVAPLCFVFLFVLAALVDRASGQQTVLDVIAADSEFSLYLEALTTVGIGIDDDSYLADSTQILTVFAPTNAAMLQDPLVARYTQDDLWIRHLRALVEFQIVLGQSLTQDDLFVLDGDNNTINTKSGPIDVAKENRTVGGQLLATPRTSAANGIVYPIDGVFDSYWRQVSLDDLAASITPSLGGVVSAAGFEKDLTTAMLSGTTFVAASDTYLNEEGNGDLMKGLLDYSRAWETREILLYNLIDQNIYPTDVSPEAPMRISTRHPGGAEMWLSKDERGVIRFNNAVATSYALAENGVFYIVDQLVSPPGIIELMQVGYLHGNLEVAIASELFAAAPWDATNLVSSLGYPEGSQFTIFLPADIFLASNLPTADFQRLLDPIWSTHLEDLLFHWMAFGKYTVAALYALAATSSGAFHVPLLSGSLAEVSLNRGEVFFEGGSLLQPADLQGVDGSIQVFESSVLPLSLSSIYQRISFDPDLTAFASVINAAGLAAQVDSDSPITLFAPEDSYLMTNNPPTSVDFVENYMFQGLLSADVLFKLARDGGTITSVNNKQYLISVLGSSVSLTSLGADSSTATIIESNILASNGIIHRIDGAFTNEALRLVTDPPTGSPTQSPTGSPTSAPTSVPTSTPTGSPTGRPTGVPTLSPTGSPTVTPTGSPTSSPTETPTGSPTSTPTSVPTSSPTGSPTASPTGFPTLSPTAMPTGTPTATPTGTPTGTPTSMPTPFPTALQVSASTLSIEDREPAFFEDEMAEPTGSLAPKNDTASPTLSRSTQTSSPTQATASPTELTTSVTATMITSVYLTGAPTDISTGVPTDISTGALTDISTGAPTDISTGAPTDIITAVPTIVPTTLPTRRPSSAPTHESTDASTSFTTDSSTAVSTGAETNSNSDEVVVEMFENMPSPSNISDLDALNGTTNAEELELEEDDELQAVVVVDGGDRNEETGVVIALSNETVGNFSVLGNSSESAPINAGNFSFLGNSSESTPINATSHTEELPLEEEELLAWDVGEYEDEEDPPARPLSELESVMVERSDEPPTRPPSELVDIAIDVDADSDGGLNPSRLTSTSDAASFRHFIATAISIVTTSAVTSLLLFAQM
ncbi:Hemolysin-type calcium-binding repeat (2 copies) [Seminavis robusta]|uniref:Hemolysin-type calcium-binding repeat (2 copies) n=1 Tax=Seminavis robusta TaxID=568900 RepID=A0A9N8HBX7_9STRA|nr:Hemolysin-type calcium-binding repeat (2 copies) [Seminavis robusta]|eukprot:Sro276_g106110.1 Hemolysin-type calcium-binding repeat (2 copies) (1105) ;mRNA; r:71889-75358